MVLNGFHSNVEAIFSFVEGISRNKLKKVLAYITGYDITVNVGSK